MEHEINKRLELRRLAAAEGGERRHPPPVRLPRPRPGAAPIAGPSGGEYVVYVPPVDDEEAQEWTAAEWRHWLETPAA